jgi:molybdenum cofactor cytidylyltransferase
MISAVVLAAGLSTRMGRQKILLPWGDSTVVVKVITTVLEGGVDDIIVVVGGLQERLEDALSEYKIKLIFNKDYRNGEMLNSLQVGIRALRMETEAVLVVLGDQPQMESSIVQAIINRFESTHHQIIVPSYKMRRGHPLLVARSHWNSLLDLNPPLTLRDFLRGHNETIDYLLVETPSVLQDLDTPNDYAQYRP